LYQVNGALGHVDSNFSIGRTFKAAKVTHLFHGISTKLFNFAAYAALYSFLLAGEDKQ
jgi:hypothetical protein